MHTISSQNAGRARVCARVYVYIVTFPVFLGVCLFAYLHICAHLYISEHKTSKFSRPSAPRQISTFARQRAQTAMSAARERKIARFFLHAATRWHSACYVRFKRNSRKFLQNFFAKNLVCVPKVRTFALAKQKWGLQHLTNLKQFDLWKHYIKLFCREVQETKWALFI